MPKLIQDYRNLPEKKLKRKLILGAVPFDKGFHFYTGPGEYTGITADSVSDFSEKLQSIVVESVLFHFQRNDYQKWIRNVVGDEELARRIDQLKKWPTWSSDENLRKDLVKAVQKRLIELQQLHPVT